ncbi:MAG: sugar phosphate isomerase/epimerase [Acidobacteria bacterium]|nr:sugar phosphate isomerase/epimerase [Acidobacteriota bacterium]MBI3278788.1 sugar phosphate isomerase/epimerase [Acidobacteriota bacterium]
MQAHLNRRQWAGSVAAALASGTLSSAAPAKQENHEGFKLGVASYSLRKFSRADAIKALKALNVEYINIKEAHAPLTSAPQELAQARRDFEEAGIKILGVGNVSFQKDDPVQIRRNFEYAKALGAPLIVMAPTRQTLPKIETMVKEYNIKAAVHNHGPEDKHFPGPKDVLAAVKDMDPRVGLCIDVGHTARTGVDVVEAIREAGPRLLDMHVKDLRALMNKASQVPVGDGAMPMPAIFRLLKKMNYQGGVMLEYEVDADNPVPGMQKSFAYMRGVLAALRS